MDCHCARVRLEADAMAEVSLRRQTLGVVKQSRKLLQEVLQ
jgi:hypothetical protein